MADKKKTIIEKAQEKGITTKKLIKGFAVGFGFILIIFMTFFDAIIDPKKLQLSTWLTNSLTVLAIMVFGIIMGESVGQDAQQEKVGGMYQNACNEYVAIRESIRAIDTFFTQWWLKHKERRLKEKKIDYLVSNQFDTMVANAIVSKIEKSDLVVGKLIFDETKPFEKIYVKEDDKGRTTKFKKLDQEQAVIVKHIFSITLDTFESDYYLSLFDEELSTNDAEKGKKISRRITKTKVIKKATKIISSLAISAVWGMLTIREFISGEGGDADAQRKAAWLNLLSRMTSLITSFASGYSTSVINVKLQSRAIQNKTDILTLYKNEYERKIFVPETYEQMIEREYQEQLKEESKKNYVDLGGGFGIMTTDSNEEIQIAESINEQENTNFTLESKTQLE